MVENERAVLLAGRQQTLGDVVYNQVLAMIMEGNLPANAKLPSETALADRFGVSRSVVRQALAKLRDERFIASRQGAGSFVAVLPEQVKADTVNEDQPEIVQAGLGFAPISSVSDLQRYFNFRIAVEGEAAAAAALNRTPEHLAFLFESLAKLEDVADTEEFGVEVDYEFHLKIAEASDNYFIYTVMKSLREHIITGMTLSRILSVKKRGARLRLAADRHRAIILAIEARDAEEARRVMQFHLSSARNTVLNGPARPELGQ